MKDVALRTDSRPCLVFLTWGCSLPVVSNVNTSTQLFLPPKTIHRTEAKGQSEQHSKRVVDCSSCNEACPVFLTGCVPPAGARANEQTRNSNLRCMDGFPHGLMRYFSSIFGIWDTLKSILPSDWSTSEKRNCSNQKLLDIFWKPTETPDLSNRVCSCSS